MTDKAFAIHYAKVLLAEAARRRGQRFHAVLLQWAAKARKEAASATEQLELFK